jgi:hypothetical protein
MIDWNTRVNALLLYPKAYRHAYPLGHIALRYLEAVGEGIIAATLSAEIWRKVLKAKSNIF